MTGKLNKILIRLLFSVAAFLLILFVLDRCYPPHLPGSGEKNAINYTQVILANDGSPLRSFPDGQHIWRHPVLLNEVSPFYIEALITYEDQWFWHHPGVNPLALIRAAMQRIWHGRIISGGSTLTMQVVRILEPIPRTFTGKAKQILRAIQLELHLSKRQILELYLTYAPMGGVLEGIESASRAYLAKPSSSLSHAEAALFAVLPQAPSRLRPDRFPERARAARDKVLERLIPLWGKEVVEDLRKEPVIALDLREPLLAPLFSERVRKRYSNQQKVLTTLEIGIQTTVEQLITSRLVQLPPRVSMAAMIVDNRTLGVVAYVGSADFMDRERFSHVDMVQGKRSPGSALKPFLYGFALDDGLIHSESLLSDVPQSFDGYQPGNFQANFSGPVSVSEALLKSLNVPAVEVLDHLGAQRFVSLLWRGGLKLDLPREAKPNLSVILGGASVNLEGLVGAYTAFARGGIAAQPRYTLEEPLIENRMMSEGAAFIIRDILESGGPVARQVEERTGTKHGIAWKTGTSFGFRDAWAVGVSDRYSVGVWVGRPDGTPNPGFFGANIAAPLLVDIFTAIDTEPPRVHHPPQGVTQAKICWPLGTRSASYPADLCHIERTAWLLNDTAPPTFTERREMQRMGSARYTDYRDLENGLRVRAACAPGETMALDMARWPSVLEPWLDATTRSRAIPPRWHPACAGSLPPEAGLKIVGISQGEIISQTGAESEDALPLIRLEARGSQQKLVWLANGAQIGVSEANRPLFYRLPEAGTYAITVLDEDGRYDRVEISVQ